MSELLKPVPYSVTDNEGVVRNFILHSFDAVTGREIISQYPMSGMPKIGDYDKNKAMMNKIMSYVCVVIEGNPTPIRLLTDEMINNHCGDWETLAKVELAMMEKNCSFFRDGRSWDFLQNFAQIFLKKISEMLILSSEPSSPTEKQPSTN